jgi:hypothetical protein
MSGAEFHQTMMGKRFIEGTMPSIARSLERIVELLEKKLEPESPADFLSEVQYKKSQVQYLVNEGVCSSMSEARRVIASGKYDSVVAKHNKES